ncbi:ABC transporter substrate-binding protein [Streptomyces sp. NPDC093085]|uniref:ABC transporter substrate-binding protein n=1 Tax=Streptomyces sp. NPDC093085 TaxID=3155068 RepID=UPI00341F07E0
MNSLLPARGPGRRTVLAAGAAGFGALLTACGDGGDGAKSAAGGSGEGGGGGSWSFRDDREKTVTAPGVPERIVAYIGSAAALHDFGVESVGVFGPTKLKDGSPDIQAGTLDVGKVTVIGNAWGEFNVEKYAALRPDLLVSNMNLPPALWYVPDDRKKKIEALAPTVGILSAKTPLLDAIGRYAALAASLGADPAARTVTEAKTRFEAASERLRKAAKAKKGLRVLAVAASQDLCHVGIPDSFVDLRYYADLGVGLTVPAKPNADGFFEELSWENVGTYPADVIMVDRRTNNLQPAELARTRPTWRELPAVKAGQVVPWINEAQFSYPGYAPLLEELAAAIEKSERLPV